MSEAEIWIVFCPRCGGSISDDSFTCRSCKTSFQICEIPPERQPEKTTQQRAPQPTQGLPQEFSTPKVLLGAVGVILAAVFVLTQMIVIFRWLRGWFWIG